MRVLQLIKSLGRGGAEVLLVETHQALARLGIENRYCYFLPWKDAVVPDLERQGGEVVNLAARTNPGILGRVPALARLLRRERVELLHCHLPIAGVAGRLAGRLAGVPVVYTEHNLQERYAAVTRRLNAMTWSMQRHVVAVSSPVQTSIHGVMGSTVPVTVVQNAVNTERFAPDTEARRDSRVRMGLAEDALVVGTVAVFRKQKRFDRWLDTAAQLRRAVPEVRFLIVGDGPLRSEVEGWIADRGLQDVVILPGLKEDPRPFLAAMDLYLMSSDFEGLPVAMLEAMAMELPVVSTRVGGIPDVLPDTWSVGERDAEALAKTCGRLLAEPIRRRDAGVLARRIVEERFGIDRMAGELAAIYRRTVERVNE